MKKITTLSVVIVLLLLSSKSFAQTPADTLAAAIGDMLKKVFSTEVHMDIDTILFDSHQANFYFNETSKAMIMTMVAPQSFAKAEEHFERESSKKGYKLLEKKKLSHNGKTILYQRGSLKKNGEKGIMYLYAVEAGPESVIFITGMHMDGDEERFQPAIERAALSASLTK